MFSKFFIIGRATAQPKEFRYTTKDGKKSGINLSVAVNKGENTTFYNVTAFKQAAKIIYDYVNKGDMIGLSGDISDGSYVDKEGKTVKSYHFTVYDVSLIGSKKQKNDDDDDISFN